MSETLFPEYVTTIEHSQPAHASITLVDWTLGNTCNFSCPYCPDDLHSGSIKWQSLRTVEAVLIRIAEHYVGELGRKVWIQFTGGEPTLHPKLPSILECAKSLGLKVSIISNGSRTLRYWNALLTHLDSVILTYHHSHAKTSEFLAVAKLLDASVPTQINVTVMPSRFDEIVGIAESFGSQLRHTSIVLKPLRINFGNDLYPYSPAQLQRLKSGIRRQSNSHRVTPRSSMRIVRTGNSPPVQMSANRLLIDGMNQWKGFRCMAGIESLRIKGNGEVMRAVCGVDGILGTIDDLAFLPVAGVTCNRESCSCIADILITKTTPM